ncbi:hypothetical protein GQ457_08G031830 [Hibiscus cannabinus]
MEHCWPHHGGPGQAWWHHRGGLGQPLGGSSGLFVQPVLAAGQLPQGMLFPLFLSRGRSRLCAALAPFVALVGAWPRPPLGSCSPLQHSRAIFFPRSGLLAGLLECFARHPSSEFCFACPPSSPSCYAYPLASPPFPRVAPANLATFVIIIDEESHETSLCGCAAGPMLIASRAPFARPGSSGCAQLQRARRCGCWDCPSPWLVLLGCALIRCARWCGWPLVLWPRGGCCACPAPWLVPLPMFGCGVSTPVVRLVPLAAAGCLRASCLEAGCVILPLALPLASFADWRLLSSARPRARMFPCSPRTRMLSCFPSTRMLSCFPSYPPWAELASHYSNLCRTPTSIRIDLHPYLFPHCRRHPINIPFSLCEFFPFVVCLHLLLMADSLLAQLGDFTFTAEEQDAVLVAPDLVAIPAEDFACSLVGKVISPPTLDGGRLIRQFRSIWKDDKLLTISEINPNFFLITFASAANRANVLKRGPWDFQKYWFALEQADPNRTIHDYSFLHLPIWVRIHNIPLSLMTAALARVLGASIGKVIMTDTRLEDASIPPPRPHKRQAPSSDPSRAKRSRACASSSSRTTSSTKAGMSSVNNSPAETARQSRREK